MKHRTCDLAGVRQVTSRIWLKVSNLKWKPGMVEAVLDRYCLRVMPVVALLPSTNRQQRPVSQPLHDGDDGLSLEGAC